MYLGFKKKKKEEPWPLRRADQRDRKVVRAPWHRTQGKSVIKKEGYDYWCQMLQRGQGR